jgi:hypothetical protein
MNKDHHVNVLFNQVTLISALTIFALVLFEVIRYTTPVMQSEIIVDGGKMVNMGKKKPFEVIQKLTLE